MTAQLGTFSGVGVGPGDPELMTLKAMRIIREADLVCVPVARQGAASLARSIASETLDPARQQILELVFAMRDDGATRSARWDEHARLIAEHLADGKDVAFLTEGDPMLYSTFVHVASALRERLPSIPIVAVPGVSSAHAAAAAALVPLADGDERLAILPATYEHGRLREAFEQFDTVVLLKVASAFDRVLGLLEELGLVDGAVFVSRCGQPGERIVRDVRSLKGQQLDYFSLMIVRRMR